MIMIFLIYRFDLGLTPGRGKGNFCLSFSSIFSKANKD